MDVACSSGWIEAKNSSQMKLEEIDSLIDKEIYVAYKRATKILKDNAALHKVLIDAMMKLHFLVANNSRTTTKKQFIKTSEVV